MQIVVCVKQVPDTAHLRFDAQDALIPDSAEAVLNPCCGYAAETAVQIKEACPEATVTVLSLGSQPAREALKRVLAMGADQAYHLLDPAFDGGDAWTTAKVLLAAIQQYVPQPDLLLFGQYTDDAMHGVTGLMVAEQLGLPSISLASKVTLAANTLARVERQTEKGLEVYELTLPGVVCMANCDVEPRIPSIKGVMKANRTDIPVVDHAALGLEAATVGQAGAVVRVLETRRKPRKSAGTKIDGSDAPAAVEQLLSFLQAQKIL